MPKYAILLRNDSGMEDLPPDEKTKLFERFVAWQDSLFEGGRYVGVERLEMEPAARTVRKKEGRLVIDGPYTEGKDAVVGFFLIEAKDFDEAMQVAAGAPSIELGSTIEVHLIGDFPKPASAS